MPNRVEGHRDQLEVPEKTLVWQLDGKGFEKLRRAGIEVEVGLLADLAGELNEAFVLSCRRGRPLVTIKALQLSASAGREQGTNQWDGSYVQNTRNAAANAAWIIL